MRLPWLFGLLSLAAAGCERNVPPAPARSLPLVASRAALDRATIGDESRYVLRGKRHRLPVEIPAHAALALAVGVSAPDPKPPKQPSWRSDLAYVDFSVRFTDERDHTQVLTERRIGEAPDARVQWHEVAVDLVALAGRRGTLTLEARPSEPALPDGDIAWATPRINTPGTAAATNVILISIDTLRADHLGCYGYRAPTSPSVDRMAREGVLFRDVVASSPWTLPSHASMFTGLDPARHGLVQFNAYRPLPQQFDTVAELLWDRGYESAGVVGGGYVGSFWHFDQGFDRYRQNQGSGHETRDTLQWVVDDATRWMESRRGRPFFLFLHTYQVHMPYTPPPPYDTAFDPEYRGPYATRLTARDLYLLQQEGRPIEPSILRHMEALYDGEIRAMDDGLGNLLAFLRSSGLARNTCVLFTSDHGEEFGEHGGYGHEHAKLYDELIRVPLIVWCPERFRGGRVIDELTSLADIAPTILELLGAAVPDQLDGKSLLPVLRGDATHGRAVAVSEVDGSIEKRAGRAKAVRTERYKLIESSVDNSELLFDLRADPAERRDLRGANAELAAQIRAAAGAEPRRPAVAAAPQRTPDAATGERLRALGYAE